MLATRLSKEEKQEFLREFEEFDDYSPEYDETKLSLYDYFYIDSDINTVLAFDKLLGKIVATFGTLNVVDSSQLTETLFLGQWSIVGENCWSLNEPAFAM